MTAPAPGSDSVPGSEPAPGSDSVPGERDTVPVPPVRELCVAMPALNEEKLIRQSLQALAAQVHKDFTLVVVDNGSTDATVTRTLPGFTRPWMSG